ncbi:uncharacterized protein [Pseudochaenichthys georgianus]|uniref:uncharacterized protein isoform X1 n=1 Tax=Pseudochaenichthys georgianus TaxID=52239 RepID=UPI00146F4C09|nr:uncharacterized protein LOC117458365 isoform X1 [Pseudochaenichthys georgianus]
MKEDHIDHFDSDLFRSSYSCVFPSRNLSQSIHPGPWKETTGLVIEYALYTILDAPYDFTITDMPALRKWWCVMLMENFDLGSHGKMFAHWTEKSKALLRGEVPPVFRMRKRKLDDITEKEEQLQPHPADVSVGKDVDKTMEAPTSKIVQDCKKAAEWVVAHKHLCTRVHLPDAVSMGEAQLREAVKLWEEKPDECNEDEMEAILEPFKFRFKHMEDMWTFLNEIRDKRGYLAFCECISV